MKRQKVSCQTCGHAMMEYAHTLNWHLVAALEIVCKNGGSAKISNIGLSHSQIANFQKLKYWGLVEKLTQKGNGGWWKATPNGFRFVHNEVKLPPKVYTYRGKAPRFEGEAVSRDEINKDYENKSDYVKNSVPHV